MTFSELLAWTIWDATRPRKILLMAILMSVGPLLAFLMVLGAERGTETGYSLVVQLAVYSFTMILLAIVFGCSAIAGEMTTRTIPYLVTRPVSRTLILLAKYTCATIVVTVASAVGIVLSAVVCGINNVGVERVLHDLWVVPVGAAVYCAVCVALSAILVRPVLPAVFYAFAFESWVWIIPGDFPKLSIMTYLRVLADHTPPDTGAPRGMMDFLTQLAPTQISRDQAWTTLALVIIVSLTVAVIAFGRGEYVPKEEAA